jgi:hypothetical protein
VVAQSTSKDFFEANCAEVKPHSVNSGCPVWFTAPSHTPPSVLLLTEPSSVSSPLITLRKPPTSYSECSAQCWCCRASALLQAWAGADFGPVLQRRGVEHAHTSHMCSKSLSCICFLLDNSLPHLLFLAEPVVISWHRSGTAVTSCISLFGMP